MPDSNLFIVCYKKFEESKMDSFKTDKNVLDFIKAAKEDTVIENIFSIDCYGNVLSFEIKFNGQFYLEEVVKSNG